MNEPDKMFLEAYKTYSDELFRFALFKLNNREKAKDVVQDAFMKTWLYISKSGEIHNIRAFLYKATGNIVIDEYRKQGRRDHKTDSLEELSENGYEPSFNDTESIIDNIDGKQALELLRELPEIYAQVLFLRYSEDLDVPEIAKLLNQTDNAISVRLNRGMRKLKELYKSKQNI
jgi:RNA polymerase sigma-70 factor (ECF subfamily)